MNAEILKNVKVRKGRLRDMLAELELKGIVGTAYYRGSGRYTQLVDNTYTISRMLDDINVKHEIGNDAPRGGKIGNFIKIIN